MEGDYVSMGRRSTCVRFVKEREFVSRIKKRVCVRVVGGVECARPRCVRRRLTGSTKDISYAALSICSRPVVRNYKTKKTTVATYVKDKFPDVAWICDRKIEGGCSRRQPDLFLDMGSHIVIVEVDENKHDTYDRTYENRRLMELSQDLTNNHSSMIRFKPDG